jgi:hypothetical protein
MQKPFDYNDLITRVQEHFSYAQKISAWQLIKSVGIGKVRFLDIKKE